MGSRIRFWNVGAAGHDGLSHVDVTTEIAVV